jgi:hypothetical protein
MNSTLRVSVDLDVGGKILKWILQKRGRKLQTRRLWLSIAAGIGTFRDKLMELSASWEGYMFWTGELPSAYKGLRSMELVNETV